MWWRLSGPQLLHYLVRNRDRHGAVLCGGDFTSSPPKKCFLTGNRQAKIPENPSIPMYAYLRNENSVIPPFLKGTCGS
jgi:hypothetical protein